MTTDVDPEFEATAKLVLDYLHEQGYPDAALMPDAGSGLYDIDAEHAVVEVTVGAPPSRPDVQRLDGVARGEERPALYFSLRGFTSSAKEWADNVNIALFSVNGDDSEIIAVNSTAEEIAKEPPSREEALLAAAARAVEVGKEELREEQLREETDGETLRRIEEAKERKAMRRNLLG